MIRLWVCVLGLALVAPKVSFSELLAEEFVNACEGDVRGTPVCASYIHGFLAGNDLAIEQASMRSQRAARLAQCGEAFASSLRNEFGIDALVFNPLEHWSLDRLFLGGMGFHRFCIPDTVTVREIAAIAVSRCEVIACKGVPAASLLNDALEVRFPCRSESTGKPPGVDAEAAK